MAPNFEKFRNLTPYTYIDVEFDGGSRGVLRFWRIKPHQAVNLRYCLRSWPVFCRLSSFFTINADLLLVAGCFDKNWAHHAIRCQILHRFRCTGLNFVFFRSSLPFFSFFLIISTSRLYAVPRTASGLFISLVFMHTANKWTSSRNMMCRCVLGSETQRRISLRIVIF